MKPKKISRKLRLNKQTVDNLTVEKMKFIRGGDCDGLDNDYDGMVDEPSEVSCGLACLLLDFPPATL